jgi:hypothetical protein
VRLTSDPALFAQPQVVTASIGGRVVGTARVAPQGVAYLRVRLRPQRGECRVVFEVAKTKVPAEGTNGASSDTRELGAHFLDFHVSR